MATRLLVDCFETKKKAQIWIFQFESHQCDAWKSQAMPLFSKRISWLFDYLTAQFCENISLFRSLNNINDFLPHAPRKFLLRLWYIQRTSKSLNPERDTLKQNHFKFSVHWLWFLWLPSSLHSKSFGSRPARYWTGFSFRTCGRLFWVPINGFDG